MYTENITPAFDPIKIVLESEREVELMLALLLLAKNPDNGDTNFEYMFEEHNICKLGKILTTQEMEKYTNTFGNLLAKLNKNLRR